MNGLHTIIALPDSHWPWADLKASTLALKVVKAVKPETIVFLGDWLDCNSLSFFSKHPDKLDRLKQEVAIGAAELKKYRGHSDEVVFCEGNHCERLQRYIAAKAPELYGLVNMRELLGLTAKEWVPYRKVRRIGKVGFSHDFSYAGGHAALSSLKAYGSNCVFGHTHRAALVYDGSIHEETRFALNCGWLGSLKDIDYLHAAQTRDWQHGIGLIRQDNAGNSWAQFLPFIKNSCVVDGKVIHV